MCSKFTRKAPDGGGANVRESCFPTERWCHDTTVWADLQFILKTEPVVSWGSDKLSEYKRWRKRLFTAGEGRNIPTVWKEKADICILKIIKHLVFVVYMQFTKPPSSGLHESWELHMGLVSPTTVISSSLVLYFIFELWWKVTKYKYLSTVLHNIEVLNLSISYIFCYFMLLLHHFQNIGTVYSTTFRWKL